MLASSPEAAVAICIRTWLKTFRRPVALAFSFLQPLIWMLLFGFLFHRYGLDALPGLEPRDRPIAYLDFLTPGVCTMTILFGASQSGIGWIRDLQTGLLQRMLLCPVRPAALLLGKIVADVLRLLAQAVVVLVLGVLLGAHLDPLLRALPAAVVALALFAAALASLSCAVALRTQSQEAMATFVHVINMPLLFTSTVLVPREQMTSWLAVLASWNPLSLAADAWRGAILLGRVPGLREILPLGALALLLFLTALWSIRRVPSA